MVVHMCPSQECAMSNHGQGYNQTPKGWFCPKCDTVNSTYVTTCSNCTNMIKNSNSLRSNCSCLKENGGSGICGCVLGNQIIS